MLPKENRLKGTLVFDKIKKEGKMYQSENFGLLVLDRDKDVSSRFGIIVSSKVSKRAVERNRVKRIINEAIRQNLDKIKKGYDTVFLVKKTIVDKKQIDIQKEVGEAIGKAKLI